ncbi:conserved hypothetical protein [Verticillium alfalfae VaMs.102]|uniref:High-affinity nicotinic acid transporter n=1 Tax=Verticillium alfalfae (strain VaMs.102 / ATCC MYA-4576 / FGSC 10136) TaxID=526221 RepID=C9SCQ7_VERA1|nr:conserved hypothetical protein [Verticillium alfalfae VaMs.102]EEY16872.1 conserved hypothetical protein [Verticillium alfalfae VaMs.102]
MAAKDPMAFEQASAKEEGITGQVEGPLTHAAYRKLVHKIDRRLITTCGFMYCVSLVDRTNLGSKNNNNKSKTLELTVGYRYDGLGGLEGWRWIFLMEGLSTDRRVLSGLTAITYAVAYFLPMILRDQMGFSLAASQCLIAPPYFVACLYMFATAWISDKYRIRGPVMMFNSVVGIAGLALMSNNIRGQWKRAFGSATLIGSGGVGGVAGSLMFRSQDAPGYRPGIIGSIACGFLVLFVICFNTWYFKRENAKADRGEKVLQGHPDFRREKHETRPGRMFDKADPQISALLPPIDRLAIHAEIGLGLPLRRPGTLLRPPHLNRPVPLHANLGPVNSHDLPLAFERKAPHAARPAEEEGGMGLARPARLVRAQRAEFPRREAAQSRRAATRPHVQQPGLVADGAVAAVDARLVGRGVALRGRHRVGGQGEGEAEDVAGCAAVAGAREGCEGRLWVGMAMLCLYRQMFSHDGGRIKLRATRRDLET